MGRELHDQPIVGVSENRVIATMLDMEPLTKVHMVKIDVQGAELHVLDGMQRLLAKNPTMTLLIEVHKRYGITQAMVMERLADFPNVKVIF